MLSPSLDVQISLFELMMGECQQEHASSSHYLRQVPLDPAQLVREACAGGPELHHRVTPPHLNFIQKKHLKHAGDPADGDGGQANPAAT